MPKFHNGQFCWIDLATTDLDAAAAFYETAFGWQAVATGTDENPYRMLQQGGKTVGGMGLLTEEMQTAGARPIWNAYIQTASVRDHAAKITAHGGRMLLEPVAIEPHGTLAVFQDPAGAVCSLWEPGENRGVEIHNEPVSLSWVELATRDLDAAATFYTNVFEWSLSKFDQAENVDYRIVHVGEEPSAGLLGMDARWGDMPSTWWIYLNVADVEAMSRRVTEAGGKVMVEPFDVPGVGRAALVQDSLDAAFYLIQIADENKGW